MTYGISRISDCVSAQEIGQEYALAGWAHCKDKLESRLWRSHAGILTYYSRHYSTPWMCTRHMNDDPADICLDGVREKGSERHTNGIIPMNQHGDLIAAIDVISPNRELFDDFNEITDDDGVELEPSIERTGAKMLGNYETSDDAILQRRQDLFDFLINHNTIVINENNGYTHVRLGDYIVVSREEPQQHGFIVAGWGETVSCDAALSTVLTINNNLYLDYSTANNATNITAPVPYIIDFSGGRDVVAGDDDQQHQIPRPRPFYCTLYDSDGDPNSKIDFQTVKKGFEFYSMPEKVSITADELYVSQEWTWISPTTSN